MGKGLVRMRGDLRGGWYLAGMEWIFKTAWWAGDRGGLFLFDFQLFMFFGTSLGNDRFKMNDHGRGLRKYCRADYGDITRDEKFWDQCKQCVNYPILEANRRERCLCTAMVFFPGRVEEESIS